jgi:hypothetical protein
MRALVLVAAHGQENDRVFRQDFARYATCDRSHMNLGIGFCGHVVFSDVQAVATSAARPASLE